MDFYGRSAFVSQDSSLQFHALDGYKNFEYLHISLSSIAVAKKCLRPVHVRTLLFRIYTKDKFKLFLFSPTCFFHICGFSLWYHVSVRDSDVARSYAYLQCSSIFFSEYHLRRLVIESTINSYIAHLVMYDMKIFRLILKFFYNATTNCVIKLHNHLKNYALKK